jgi:hypothetical protein
MAWEVGDIVQQVIKRTENRTDSSIDFRQEFFLGLDEFCNSRRFWWRKKDFILPLSIGVASYDFSTLAPDFAGQIQDVYLLNGDGTVGCQLTPIVTEGGLICAKTATVANTPAGYLLDVTTSLFTLRLQAPSSVAQSLFITYWASPMVTDVDSTEVIPLVPQSLHYGLFNMLERRIYEILYGQEDPRWMIKEKSYQTFLVEASRIRHWSGRKAQEMSADDIATTSGGGLHYFRDGSGRY